MFVYRVLLLLYKLRHADDKERKKEGVCKKGGMRKKHSKQQATDV